MKCLNLGCGSRYLEGWHNLDFTKTGETVIAHDILSGIPFPDNHFEMVYHSHLLEHLSMASGRTFMVDCWRVLKPGGVMRVVVPDLEGIVREYLRNLDAAVHGSRDAEVRYDWIILELLDQLVRNSSGGEMLQLWKQPKFESEAYVEQRLGGEFTAFRARLNADETVANKTLTRRKGFGIRWRLASAILGNAKAYDHFSIGRFRSQGEIHKWMYDRYSLGRLLVQSGFKSASVMTAFTSANRRWETFQWLDVEDGKVRKPDSLFMEAIK
jgi:SAM-dependent methyltransferase